MPGALGAPDSSALSAYAILTFSHPEHCLSCSTLTPPGLSIAGGEQSPSTTVLSKPTSQGPPSSTCVIRPSRSCATCSAVVGEGFVDAFAEGAATGTFASRRSESATGFRGIRAPNVFNPTVTDGAKGDGFGSGRSIVNGPGQNFSINSLYMLGIGSLSDKDSFCSSSRICCMLAKCTMSGLSLGRPLTL